ncbi:signal peptidase II, partial [Rhizobium ruizarguesonis]
MNEQTHARPALFARPAPIPFSIFVAVLIDQVVKITVDHTLPLQEAVPVIPMLALY